MTEEMKMSKAEEELLTQQFAKDLENAKEERKRAELVLIEHKTMLEEFEKLQPMVENYLNNITPQNVKKIDPEYYYEKDDKYWELMAQVQRIEWLQKYFTVKDKNIKGMRDTIVAKEAAIDSLNEKISRMESE